MGFGFGGVQLPSFGRTTGTLGSFADRFRNRRADIPTVPLAAPSRFGGIVRGAIGNYQMKPQGGGLTGGATGTLQGQQGGGWGGITGHMASGTHTGGLGGAPMKPQGGGWGSATATGYAAGADPVGGFQPIPRDQLITNQPMFNQQFSPLGYLGAMDPYGMAQQYASPYYNPYAAMFANWGEAS